MSVLDRDLRIKTGPAMREPTKRTCKGCPWRRDANPGALGGWTPTMYMQASLMTPADIACHMSKHFDGHVEQEEGDPRPRSCAGLAAFRANVGADGGAHPLSSTFKAIEEARDNAELRAEVFASPNEFILHHDTPEAREARFWAECKGGCTQGNNKATQG